MPGEFIKPSSFDYAKRYCKALKSTFTICNLSWKCPHCDADNQSQFDGARLRRVFGSKVDVKCGKCHGQNVTLLDGKGRTLRYDELLK